MLKDFGLILSLVEFKHMSVVSRQPCQQPSKGWVLVGEPCASLDLPRRVGTTVLNHWQVDAGPGLSLAYLGGSCIKAAFADFEEEIVFPLLLLIFLSHFN